MMLALPPPTPPHVNSRLLLLRARSAQYSRLREYHYRACAVVTACQDSACGILFPRLRGNPTER